MADRGVAGAGHIGGFRQRLQFVAQLPCVVAVTGGDVGRAGHGQHPAVALGHLRGGFQADERRPWPSSRASAIFRTFQKILQDESRAALPWFGVPSGDGPAPTILRHPLHGRPHRLPGERSWTERQNASKRIGQPPSLPVRTAEAGT
ncbi:hypothetical protein [Rhodanobacter lindaniclasticus]